MAIDLTLTLELSRAPLGTAAEEADGDLRRIDLRASGRFGGLTPRLPAMRG